MRLVTPRWFGDPEDDPADDDLDEDDPSADDEEDKNHDGEDEIFPIDDPDRDASSP